MNQLALGNRIREERKKLNLTQEQLAEKMDVSATYIGFVERGERTITLGKLTCLANVLGVSVDYLLADTIAVPTSNKEELILSLFASATEDQQELIINISKLILNQGEKNK
ncbi:MAG: helix-turn-helix transcriptional regulator [Lachnospiraceae bacterium]|nr:helix-turn-helix transcriptional regulator [Lachnospiraceae bacterium]